MIDAARVIRETSICHVEQHPSLPSTNSLASELLPQLLDVAPALVTADRQTAGRGRGDNVWFSTEGALTFSVVLNSAKTGLSADRSSLLALAVGMAVRNAIGAIISEPESVTVKWPNDVLIGDRKVCGILCEQQPDGERSGVIVGVGVNANNSMVQHERVPAAATSIYDVSGQVTDLTFLLVEILQQLFEQIHSVANAPAAFIRQLNKHHVLNGARVEVASGSGMFDGHCETVDECGRLVVRTSNGIVPVVSGSVVAWTQSQ